MKKTLLLAIGVSLGIFASAQSSQSRYLVKRPNFNACEPTQTTGGSFTSAQRKTPLVITNATVTKKQLGCSNNAYGGYTRPGRPILDYAPVGTSGGLLTFIHRSGPACTPSDGTAGSGYYTFDVSKDGGTTWNPAPSLGPIIDGGAWAGRYPMGGIYNPAGNTVPDSAFLTYFGVGLTGAAAPWRVHHTGAVKVGDPTVFSEQIDIFDSTVNFTGLIPDDLYIDGTGNTWAVDLGQSRAFSQDYDDTIVVRKGVWSNSLRRHVYTTTLMPFPVTKDAAGAHFAAEGAMAASANGQTVYLAVIANADIVTYTDTAYYVTIWKSTNGGTTWGSPSKVSMDVNTQMGTTGKKYSSAFQIDGTVDANGKLHLICGINVSGGSGSVATAPGTFGEFSIISDGTTHTVTLLAKPLTFSGNFGTTPIAEYNRGQMAISQNGQKVFYVWFDTDTATWTTTANTNPDAHVRMYDVATSAFGPEVNLTAGTAADGLMTFGYVANTVSTGPCGSNSYNIHMGYQSLTGTDTAPVNFYYVGGACITAVDELDNDIFSVIQVYPNPTTGSASVELNMKKANKVSIEVTNMLGQVIYSENQNLSVGYQKLNVDASKWNTGIYFYTIKSDNFTATKKLVRQ
ncbi:MAG TPA: T9SS type A sorting domain-containing protein [Bacteroidia bacterium]